MNVLLVENNLLDIEYFKLQVSKITTVINIELCQSVRELIKLLQEQEFDLIFWDFILNDYEGLEILKSFKNLPPLIAITNQTIYCIPAFELGFIDYIVKPYTFERLVLGISRVIDRHKLFKVNDEDLIFIKVGRRFQKVILSTILYGEAYGAFTKIYLITGEFILVSQSISPVLEQLPKATFKKVHKSYFINCEKLLNINSQKIKLDAFDIELPLSKTYRGNFADFLRD